MKGSSMGDSTATTCLSCHATTTNGLALCERCQVRASVALGFLPVYFRNLARWRPGRAGGRPVPGSREPRDVGKVADDRVSRALDEASSALSTWARMLAEDRVLTLPTAATEAGQVAAVCAWLAERLTTIATLEWCGEFLREDHREGEEYDGIGYHERRLRALTERVVPGWYAGACQCRITMEATCGADTFVVPGLTWVTCGRCGVTTHAAAHLDVILAEARGWVARPKALAEALVALLDTEESVPRLHKRISKWGERGQIEPLRKLDADGDAVGPKRYRLGEVLDKLLNEGATRAEGKESGSAA